MTPHDTFLRHRHTVIRKAWWLNPRWEIGFPGVPIATSMTYRGGVERWVREPVGICRKFDMKKFSSWSGWLELFGGVKCWVWHCEDPSNSGSNESFYSLWSRFFQQLKTQFSPGSIFSGCGEDSYFDATIFSEISLGGSTTIEKRIFGTTSKEIQHPRDSGPEMIVKNGGWCTKNHTQIRSEGIIQLKMKSDLLDGVHPMTT